MGEGSSIPTNPHHTPTFIQPSPQPQKTQKPRKPKRKDTQISQSSDPSDNVADEVVHKELGDSLVRAATTASSLEAKQDSGGPRFQETMGDTIAQTRFENVSKHSNDSLLARGNTLQSDEDRLKLDELMALCTTLQNKVLALEKTKTTQHNEIASLKRRVKKLEKKNRSRTHKLKRLYKVGLTDRVESSDDEESLDEDASKQGRIDAIDADEEITLVSVHDMNVSAGKEVAEEVVEVINTAKLIIDAAQVSAAGDKVSTASAATTVSAATTTTATFSNVDDITLAQALEEMKSTKPKKKGIVIQELDLSLVVIELSLEDIVKSASTKLSLAVLYNDEASYHEEASDIEWHPHALVADDNLTENLSLRKDTLLFARDCPSKGDKMMERKEISFYQDKGAGKKEQYQIVCWTMGCWVAKTSMEPNANRPRVNTWSSNVNTVRSKTASTYQDLKQLLVLKDTRGNGECCYDSAGSSLKNMEDRDNGTEFKYRNMLEFCGNKGIKQEYSNARTPQQNRVVERMNRTLIKAARTMLADSLLPTTFWAEAVNTAVIFQ
ncbi:uncharacterized mitochondrial protein-like protein [Tanacetum coccineum]